MKVDERGRCKDGGVLDGQMMEGCLRVRRRRQGRKEDKDGGMLDERR